MNKRNIVFISGFLCVAALSAAVFFLKGPGVDGRSAKDPSLASAADIHDVKSEASKDQGSPMWRTLIFPGAEGLEDFVADASSRLIKDFGSGPMDPASQMQLAGLRDYLKNLYPDSYMDVFAAIIAHAWPEQSEAILHNLEKLQAYNLWVEANKQALSQMTHDDMKKNLWGKRNELFGDDARKMWAEETRIESVTDVLDIMRDAYETSLSDKLELYTQALRRISKESPDESGHTLMNDKRASLTSAFLGLDSVQAELSDMDSVHRAASLKSIRKTMGYTDSEIAAFAAKDATNEKKWQNGYAYMSEREHLLATPDDGTRSEKLITLQERYFKNAASTIQAEEASGFFRFERPRVYGRN